MTKRDLWLTLLFLTVPGMLVGQDSRGNASRNHQTFRPRRTAAHYGSSPFSPPDADDTLFVVDTDPGLDTDCTYHSGGPLVIHLSVTRYVGPVKGDGTLANPGDLIGKHLISSKAHLRLPAYDVDVNGDPSDPTVPPEVDRVFFNGHDLGTLTGDNDIWKLNDFEVNIEWVKFPALGAPSVPPLPADNVITIDIDEASGGTDNWCTAVDWVELDFAAIAPVFMVHGTNRDSSSWDPHFTNFFRNSGAPWSNQINLTPNGTIEANGHDLADKLLGLAQSFGAKKCHIIAHSKGGLDTRAYLNNRYDPTQLKVLSVYTLSTPHHGTIVSDVTVVERKSANPQSANADLQYLIDHDYRILRSLTPQEPALGDQTTSAMAQFNQKYPGIPGEILFYNFGADADISGNGLIEASETVELLDLLPFDFIKAAAGTAMYRAIGNVASIIVTKGQAPGRLWGTNTFTKIEVASVNTPFAKNDLITSVQSAQSPFGTYLDTLLANHSSMKSESLASTILQHIISDFPNN
ncbi:MAG TPA: alpha/beta hydrolase [Thermoanaerobaculia bacterium]|jgi:triacylglycerol lipase|nr:alpha/beta hydrolase [Thermoanaerobaculia bacterium]